MPSVKSLITDIEFLSKSRNNYNNELSFAGRGLKLETREDGIFILKKKILFKLKTKKLLYKNKLRKSQI